MNGPVTRRTPRLVASYAFPVFLVLLFLVGAVARWAVIRSGFQPMAPDSTGYWEPAKSLVEEGRYLLGGRPSTERPPTYPIFLALIILFVGPNAERALIAQIVITSAFGVGSALWLKGSGASRGAAIAAGLLVSLDPFLVAASGIILSEALGAMLLTALVMALHWATGHPTWGRWALVGFLGGALGLNSLNTLALLPFLFLLWMKPWRRASPRLLLGWLIAFVLLAGSLGAWVAYGRTVVANPKWVRSPGFTSLIWGTTEYPFDWVPDPGTPDYVRLLQRFYEISGGRGPNELNEVQTEFLLAAWRNFREHPFRVLANIAKANFWFWVEIPGAVRLLRPYPWLHWVLLASHHAQLLAFVLGTWVLVRRGLPEYAVLALGCMAYFALSLMLMFPIPRYYVPVLPMMDMVAATGLAEWWRLRRAAPAAAAA